MEQGVLGGKREIVSTSERTFSLGYEPVFEQAAQLVDVPSFFINQSAHAHAVRSASYGEPSTDWSLQRFTDRRRAEAKSFAEDRFCQTFAKLQGPGEY